MTLLGDDYREFCNGDSRSFINCKTHDSMKAISLKAPGQAVNVSETVSAAGAFLKRHSVAIGVMSAMASLTGVAVGSDPLTYSAAFAALGAAYLTTETQEGGAL